MNCYDLLGLNSEDIENVTNLDIKKNYRDLMKQHHPDRNNGEESHQKTVDLNEAYDLLTYPVTKKIYDYSLKGGNTDINVNLDIDLRDIYYEETKTIRYTRSTICVNCDDANNIDDTVQNEICTVCQGKHFYDEYEDVPIQIKKFYYNNMILQYELCGNVYIDENNKIQTSSLNVTLKVHDYQNLKICDFLNNNDNDQNGNTLNKSGDLMTELKISLLESICGFCTKIDYFDKKMNIIYKGVTTGGNILIFKGRGIYNISTGLRGNLYIKITVEKNDFPENIKEYIWKSLTGQDYKNSIVYNAHSSIGLEAFY